ncbi:hypothetical protein [Streptomyces sp. NPDC057552]|uniref:hypothetical protein n=1 Tax=Streptomyces sp. NPDC057552 TaxID=3350537 RepID=UPI0036C6F270
MRIEGIAAPPSGGGAARGSDRCGTPVEQPGAVTLHGKQAGSPRWTAAVRHAVVTLVRARAV